MSDKSLLFLKAFLENVAPDKKDLLLSFLSPSMVNKLSSLSVLPCDPSSLFLSNEKVMETIHPSWFIPALKMLKSQDLNYFSSCFTEEQYSYLSKHLSLERLPLPSFAKGFLFQILLKKMDGKEIFPIECLPSSSLNELLSLSFHQLDELIELLSMHDLSVEVKKIINPNILKQLDKYLSKEQKSYLKSLLQKKEPLFFGKFNLDKWNGDADSLKKMLLSRGLNRLAKAFSRENPVLIWYMIHHLEKELGQTFKKLVSDVEPEMKEVLLSQVMNLVPRLKGEYPR